MSASVARSALTSWFILGAVALASLPSCGDDAVAGSDAADTVAPSDTGVPTDADPTDSAPDTSADASDDATADSLTPDTAEVADTTADTDTTPSGVGFSDLGAAARFLDMATMGATRAEAEHLLAIGVDAWFSEQIAEPPCRHYDPALTGFSIDPEVVFQRLSTRHQIWFTNAVTCRAQLRQRVAFALSNILVVSEVGALLLRQDALALYTEILEAHALGDFRELLEAVTRSPAMGSYLNMLGNTRAVPALGIRPDENFAREVQQLFTIGLVELEPDGTPRLDEHGEPIPTYDQDIIESFARAFTGWAWHGVTTIADFITTARAPDLQDYTRPMSPVDDMHDTDAKALLLGQTLPAGNDTEADLEGALDVLASHPNVGPFIGRQLIQRLVSSNPSPAFVARVAAVFDDDGRGQRGNLEAVVRAILTDEEALSGQAPEPYLFGRLRDPLLRVTHLWRAFDAVATDDDGDGYAYRYLTDYHDLGQAMLSSPSVFNFFTPSYSPPGPLRDAGLLGPEYQILTEEQLARTSNVLGALALIGYVGAPDFAPLQQIMSVRLDYSEAAAALDTSTDALLDHLDVVLLGGSMTEATRRVLRDAITAARLLGLSSTQTVAEVVHLLILSPQYVVQR